MRKDPKSVANISYITDCIRIIKSEHKRSKFIKKNKSMMKYFKEAGVKFLQKILGIIPGFEIYRSIWV